MRSLRALVLLLLAVTTAPPVHAAPKAAVEDRLGELRLPPGFRIEVFAKVPSARSLALGPKGTLFVGTRGDEVHAVSKGRVTTVASGLNEPNGVAVRDGALYVAEISRILRYDAIEEHLDRPPQPAVVRADFPKEEHHGWKFIAFGPDGKLYVPVGAPCNVCDRGDSLFATITRMDPDGTNREVFARGVRNTVGFDWAPGSGVLWFTDNGRDRMGDDVPPDELNRAPKPGLHFGFPHCHGADVVDPEHGKGGCAAYTPPVAAFAAHVAALGMRFYTGSMFPESYRGDIFVAQHGSWNRTTPIGYRVVHVDVHDGGVRSVTPFAEGWLEPDGSRWGRPVDVLVMPDGALLVSDDHAGVVYRITYAPPRKEAP